LIKIKMGRIANAASLYRKQIAAVNGGAISIWSAPTRRGCGRRDLSQQVCENAPFQTGATPLRKKA